MGEMCCFVWFLVWNTVDFLMSLLALSDLLSTR